MNLVSLGWNAEWAEQFQPYAADGWAPARICVEHKELYQLYSEQGEFSAVVSGKLRHTARGRQDFPAVGDWVAVQLHGEKDPAVIHAVLPRKNKFARKVAGRETEEQIVAANLDTVFLVSSLNQDFNVRRLERYLSLTWASGADPVILLSKSDLCADSAPAVEAVEAIAYGAPIHRISAKTGDGLEGLARYLQSGMTVALLGSSGVGKSTLVNRLLDQPLQEVQEIRVDDDRGRHTTTRREMLRLPQGGLLIDNPGMRELQLWDSDAGIDETFADVVALTGECFFRDCTHEGEPRCAVRLALEEGRLTSGRWENYRKLQKELRYLNTRQDSRAMQEYKRVVRRIHVQMNKVKRRKH
jgi:ribosome biogenesis GTPase